MWRGLIADMQTVRQPAAVPGVVASASRLAVEVRLVLEAKGASRRRSNCAALSGVPRAWPWRAAEQAWRLLLLKTR